VSGVVTAGGAPLAAAWVVLTPVTEAGDWAGEPSQTTTDQSGHYVFPDVSSAQVKVHVRAPLTGDHVATYWPGVHTFSQAGPARWLRATGIGASGVIRVDAGQESEVVVTLARSQPATPGCSPADAWHGLFGGFLDPDPWPREPACVPTTDSTSARMSTQRDCLATGLAKTTLL
jgi:hypothetical protein